MQPERSRQISAQTPVESGTNYPGEEGPAPRVLGLPHSSGEHMPSKADSPTKTCTYEGCTKPLRARGLCGTHCNQAHQPNRHAKTRTQCANCGEPIQRARKADRRPACSPACRHALAGQQYGAGQYDWAARAATRARRSGATVREAFTADEIHHRDGWTCYLCKTELDRYADCFQPNSATIDHVIPLSRGGEHSRANVRSACLMCNSTKQASLIDAA